jgi:hypothetical protein
VQLEKRLLLAGAAILSIMPTLAGAQTISGSLAAAEDAGAGNFRRDRNVSVRQRPHPGYEAVGLRTGAFMVWPKVTGTVERNDNIFATDTDEQDDTIFHITPEVGLQSTWSRHALNAYARAIVHRYSDFSTEDTEDYQAGINGRLDALRTAQINAGVDWSRLTEPRTSASAEGQARPVQYELASAYLSGARELNRLRLSSRFDIRNFTYLARVGNTPTDDRDRTVTSLSARGDYAVSPDTALFVEVAGNKRAYRLESPPPAAFPNFVDRDSDGFQVLAGANFEVSALVRGELGVGYLSQNFQNNAFGDIEGFGGRGQLEWFPTQLVTVTLTGARTVEDAGVIGASGYLSTNVGGQVDYELMRNVIITGRAGYGDDDYKGIDRNDKRSTAGLAATYLMNRSMGLTVSYDYSKQKSKGVDSGNDFKVNRIGATLTLQY